MAKLLLLHVYTEEVKHTNGGIGMILELEQPSSNVVEGLLFRDVVHKKSTEGTTIIPTSEEINQRSYRIWSNSSQGQIVTSIGYYLGLLVTNLNDRLIILPRSN